MLRIHFLNVGHGDCTVIQHHSGNLTVVDINNSQKYDAESHEELVAEQFAMLKNGSRGLFTAALAAESYANEVERQELTDPIRFLKDTYPGKKIFRYIQTHPDMDHMRGLKRLYDEIGFTNFWDTKNTKPTPSFSSDADREDWEFYQSLRSGRVTEIEPKYYERGDSFFAFGKDQNGFPGGDGIEILSPTRALVNACNASGKSNDLSLVLRIRHAGKSILLPGDAEEVAWADMVATYGQRLQTTYLKASHHGRDSGFHREAIQLIKPDVICVSVGRKPSTDAHRKYRYHCELVRSTRYHGNLHLTIDDSGNQSWTADRNTDE
jgi:beta-lactamase superfamily II metal-dependent hydrolase